MDNPGSSPPPTNFPTILGWICFGIGLLTFWVFGLGFLFLLGAIAIAVTALVRTQSRQGLVLLVFSAGSLPVCAIVFVVLVPFLAFFGIAASQQMRLTNFFNPTSTTLHSTFRPTFSIMKAHSFVTRTKSSPDGGTYFVMDDSATSCSSIQIDGEPWGQQLHTPGPIEPGRHVITCDDSSNPHPFHFKIEEGKTLSVKSWKP